MSEPGGDPKSTFWQNEDMDVDQSRKLVLISRDPRSYRGSTSREPGETDPNGATNIAGVYVVDARNPARLKLLAFQQLPTGHTTTCINDCRWLWTGGPAATTTQQKAPLNWTGGRPLIVTDLRDPAHPVAHADKPIDLFRQDGVTAYSHDVQVDDMGIAWVSGQGGTRGYWTDGWHRDPLTGRKREATALNPIPYAGGGFPESETADDEGGFEHNAERPVGRNAPAAYRSGKYLIATEEDFADADLGCSQQGHFNVASLDGSYNGEAWRSTPARKFRLKVVGSWAPVPAGGLAAGRRALRAGRRLLLGALLRRAREHGGLRLVRRGHAVPGHLQPAAPGPDRVLAAGRHARVGVVLPRALRLHRGSRARDRGPAPRPRAA